jgi:hypothetical protein
MSLQRSIWGPQGIAELTIRIEQSKARLPGCHFNNERRCLLRLARWRRISNLGKGHDLRHSRMTGSWFHLDKKAEPIDPRP